MTERIQREAASRGTSWMSPGGSPWQGLVCRCAVRGRGGWQLATEPGSPSFLWPPPTQKQAKGREHKPTFWTLTTQALKDSSLIAQCPPPRDRGAQASRALPSIQAASW